ncbi:hypothetical protein IW261DRAFT_181157 [Armillaria novae-zelandiae]|uniref:C2H2-type domain-containing protein n=1 Tax=Armillaria novae-zelandiae TaxID=153914 RepID=A0AA39P761_9AGAR|nr:hypothetical protein IW261DRAFT_181157 [Armillaria novae-zelandiae]
MSTYNPLEYQFTTSKEYGVENRLQLPEGYVDQYGASTSHPGKSVATTPLHLPFLNTAQPVYDKPSSWPPMSAVSPFFSPDSSGAWSSFASLSTEMTPDLLFSSPSALDDCPNVFDIQFGRSLHHQQQQKQREPEPQPPPHFPEQFSSPQLRAPPSINNSNIIVKSSPNLSSQDNASSRRRHPCLIPGCQRRFTSQYTLKVHMQAHKPKPRVSFVCTLGCGERFSRQHDRLRHEVAKHNKICEFSCEACGRFFSMAKTLGNHKCPCAQGGTRWVNN